MKLNRPFVLLAALLPAVLSSYAQIQPPAPGLTRMRPAEPRRTSIIFFACQGLALGDLSCYGQTNFQTPNIDRLASGGMRFTDYGAAADELPRAQAALMAGNGASSSPGQATLAARLQQAGYHTGLLGLWTLGAQPWTQGFDEFAGYFSQAEADDYYSDFIWRHAPAGVHGHVSHTLKEQIYANSGGKKAQFMPDLLMSVAGNFAHDNVPDAANHFRPFFLLVNLPEPHSVTPGKDDYPAPTDAPFSGEHWPQAAKNRAALLDRLDNQLGRLLERLASDGLTNDVALFFAGAVAPGKFSDTNMDFLKLKDETRGGQSPARLRVPMLVYWPGHVTAGRVSHVPWGAADFAATALAIAGANPQPGSTGVSQLPELLGRQPINNPATQNDPNRTPGP